MTAIRDIKIGERISIDYGNNFYHPTGDRMESLQESYGFICKCSMCLGPDKKRAFICNKCHNGVICPISMCASIEENHTFSPCSSCGNSSDLAYRTICIEKEDTYKNEPPKSLLEARNISTVEKILHETHYLIFWACDDLAMLFASRARALAGNSNGNKGSGDVVIESRQCYREALDAMCETERLLDIMLPPVHHEKVVYYDRLGQLAVAAGEMEFSNSYFKKAYEMSRLASGNNTPSTLQIKLLIDNPPKDLQQLIKHYEARGGKVYGGNDEDEEGDEEDDGETEN